MQGKTVMITGASRGIGADAARAFAAEGAKVALLARAGDAVAAIADEIGANARAISCDVSDWNAMSAAIAECEAELGPVDVLINNAGVIEPISHLASADPAEWGHVIDINLKGVFYGMRAAVPGMVPSPASTSHERYSESSIPLFLCPKSISSGEYAWMWRSG